MKNQAWVQISTYDWLEPIQKITAWQFSHNRVMTFFFGFVEFFPKYLMEIGFKNMSLMFGTMDQSFQNQTHASAGRVSSACWAFCFVGEPLIQGIYVVTFGEKLMNLRSIMIVNGQKMPYLKIPLSMAKWLRSPLVCVIIKICKKHLVLHTKSSILMYIEK